MSYQKILIVTDDNPSALKAAICGYELARQLKAKVALLGVVEEALTEGNVDAGIFPKDAKHDMKQQMEEFLSNIEKEYSKGVKTERFAPEGEVKETVLQMSRTWKADLIVAGTHGRKGLSRLLEGSMAEGVLRDSKVPLFIVPMDKE
ncbi:universal stress protein [Mucilaginibacter sp.]|jgi:nucleotide-binding universal stress UspA family protein|uniref:universal stress protein n=1 Tax=Mucilaginibacter sp. TaxID=1882438 RepID=UPI0035669478